MVLSNQTTYNWNKRRRPLNFGKSLDVKRKIFVNGSGIYVGGLLVTS